MDKVESRSLQLFESKEFSDCVFLVGQLPDTEEIKAHKVHLASSSSVFATMFFGSMQPEGSEPIRIPDIRVEIFKAMLKYIYTDQLSLNDFEEASDLYYCANKYMMPALAKESVNYMKSVLSFERVLGIYEFAKRFEEPELLQECVKVMRTQTQKILTHSSWENAAKATVSVLFEQDALAIESEIELYCALVAWATAECERRSLPSNEKSMRSVSGDLITKIRFLTLTPEQFAMGLRRTRILSKEEIFAILMNILSVENDMPKGFCVERSSRCSNKQVSVARTIAPKTSVPGASESGPNGPIYCFFPDNGPYYIRDRDPHSEYLCFRTVNAEIKVHGVVLPPIPADLESQIIRKEPHDFENAEVTLCTGGNSKLLALTYFTGSLRGNANVEIKFDAPVSVKKNQFCSVDIDLQSRNYCSVTRRWRVDSACEGVEFEVLRESSRPWHAMALGILFSK